MAASAEKLDKSMSERLKAEAAAATAAALSPPLRDAKGRMLSKPPWLIPMKPGENRNPTGKGGQYTEVLKLCRKASPEAARKVIALIDSEDDRVAFMAASWVTDRAWGKAKEYDPTKEDSSAGPKFNPRDYSPEQLDVIEAALRLMLNPPKPKEPEIIPPAPAS